jgi:signal transduction histidine kinase
MNDKLLGKPVSLTDLKNGDLARISTLIRLLAHEIRNPLNALVLNLKVLDKKIDDPVLRDALTASLEQTKRVDSILSDFVDFTRPKRPDFDNVDIEELLSELCVFVRPQAEIKNTEIAFNAAGNAAEFVTDRNLLNQALLNLLLNAIEVTERGLISLFAAIDKPEEGAKYLLIGVEDSGPGFENAADAFKPFYSTKNGGTGLGLTAAAAIADALGGEVKIENTDIGARVYLKLPQQERE